MQSGKAKPTQDRAEAAGTKARGWPIGEEEAHGQRGRRAPVLTRLATCSEPGWSSASQGYRRGPLSWRVEAAPRPSYESAAGQVSRGGSYGKAPGEGRGASTVAISRLAEHFWHSWDPQEFASWSQGGHREGRTGPCDGHSSRDGAGGTGEKGSGRGLGRKSCSLSIPLFLEGEGTSCDPVPCASARCPAQSRL